MSRRDGPVLVLGIGNMLLRDDGVGVHVVHALQDLVGRGDVVLPADTSLVDGGTLGRDLLPWLADARAVLLVDAVAGDRPPGTIEVTRGDRLASRAPEGVSTHRTGVGDMLDAARAAGVLPRAVALVGVAPDEIDVGLDLSASVRAAMPALIQTTIEEVHRLEAIAPWGPDPIADGSGSAGATA